VEDNKHAALLRLYAMALECVELAEAMPATIETGTETTLGSLQLGFNCSINWAANKDLSNHLNRFMWEAAIKRWPEIRAEVIAAARAQMEEARSALLAYESANKII